MEPTTLATYVDDTFTAVQKDEIDDFHEHLNKQNAHQKYTSQEKINDTCTAIAMATLLAPVSFWQKPNIPICNPFKCDRGPARNRRGFHTV